MVVLFCLSASNDKSSCYSTSLSAFVVVSDLDFAHEGSLLYFILICNSLVHMRPSLVAQLVNNTLASQETPVQFLGQEDPLEKG